MVVKDSFLCKKVLLKVIFLALIFVFSWRVIIDPDLGWHLMVGKYIWQTKTVPQKDLFSFSLSDYPYVYHSWLTEFLLYPAYARFGLWGVNLFYGLLLAASAWLTLKTSQLRVRRDWPYLFLLFTFPLVILTTYLRTKLFTLLGLSFVYFVFRQSLKGQTKLFWWLPLVFVIWANLHGGFFLGLGFWLLLLAVELVVFLIREILPFGVFGRVGRCLPRRGALKLFLVFLLSLLTALINPYGLGVYRQAFLMGTNQFATRINNDWLPLVRADGLSWLFALLLFGGMMLLFLVKNSVELREKLVIAVLFALALKLNRFSVPLMVVLLPTLVFFLEEISQKNKEIFRPLRLALFLLSFFLFVFYFGYAYEHLTRMKKAYADEGAYAQEMEAPYTYPYGAVEYIRKNPVPERILNDYNWGGYLIWKLPERRFFIDGRMDNFFVDGESFAKKHWETINLDPGWEKLLEEYQIEAVLLSSQWPLSQALKLSPQWQVLYEDETSLLLEKLE